MSEKSLAELMMTREHPRIAEKREIWRLISQSYRGGSCYGPENLFQYPKESATNYAERARRAVYFNHVQPLADIVAGFVYSSTPTRKIPDPLVPFAEKTSRGKGVQEFMSGVAIHSLQYTCGVLVDMPRAPEGMEIRTKADAMAAGLQPYAVLYFPHQICDWAVDDSGALLWVLLDNSSAVDVDPTQPRRKTVARRLWTRDYFQDFEESIKDNKKEYVAQEQVANEFGAVPFRFVNWRDIDDDQIAETPFEDIALLDRKYFNAESYLDEMLAAGTFKSLFWQGTEESFPSALITKGVGSLSVVTYPEGANQPAFDGVGLEDAAPFLAAVRHYEEQMLQKLGMDPDHDKKFVQSGVAKSLEFEKCEAILRAGAAALESLERWMFEAAANWLGTEAKAEITYNRGFQGEQIDTEITRLQSLLLLRTEGTFRRKIEELIVRKATANLSEAEKAEIKAALDEPTSQQTPDDLAGVESGGT